MERKFLEDHLGLVKSIVCKFEHTNLMDSDLFGVGCLALVEAHKSYDPNRGSFSTWATKIIKQSIFDNFKKNKKIKNIEKENDIIDESKPEFPQKLFSILLKEDLNETKTDRQNKKILVDHFINNKTWAEIGREMSLTRERVRQKGLEAIEKIRKKYRLILDDIDYLYIKE